MARVKLTMPDFFLGQFDLPIRVDDINYGNHLANQQILVFAHEARLRFLKKFDMNEQNFLGHSLIMGDAEISFKNEGFWGMNLTVALFLGDVTSHGFEIYYQMSCEKKIIAEAKTGLVFYDYNQRKIHPVPEDLMAFFKKARP